MMTMMIGWDGGQTDEYVTMVTPYKITAGTEIVFIY